jgi:hypothetical protein
MTSGTAKAGVIGLETAGDRDTVSVLPQNTPVLDACQRQSYQLDDDHQCANVAGSNEGGTLRLLLRQITQELGNREPESDQG